MRRLSVLFPALFLFFTLGCSTSGEDTTALESLFLQPVITSVEPQVGHPAFTNSGESFPATDVVIKGRGFTSVITNNVVHFSGVQASVISATETELTTSVPAGTKTGILSYANGGMGGTCNEGGGQYGLYCSSTDFYVNCYLPYDGRYDTELSVVPYNDLTVTFNDNLEVRAFKVDVQVPPKTVQVTCAGAATASLFSPVCGVTYFTNATTPAVPLTFSINTAYTAQFFILSAVAGDCTLTAY